MLHHMLVLLFRLNFFPSFFFFALLYTQRTNSSGRVDNFVLCGIGSSQSGSLLSATAHTHTHTQKIVCE